MNSRQLVQYIRRVTISAIVPAILTLGAHVALDSVKSSSVRSNTAITESASSRVMNTSSRLADDGQEGHGKGGGHGGKGGRSGSEALSIRGAFSSIA